MGAAPLAHEHQGLDLTLATNFQAAKTNSLQAGQTGENMVIGGYTFVHICNIEPLRGADGSLLALMPQDRYEKRHLYRLNKYGAGPFCKFKIPNIHGHAGVYIISAGDQIRYIGETANLAKRYNMGYGNISPKNCYKGGQETNVRLNNLVYQSATANEALSLWFYKTDDYKAVETMLRAAHRAPWNRV